MDKARKPDQQATKRFNLAGAKPGPDNGAAAARTKDNVEFVPAPPRLTPYGPYNLAPRGALGIRPDKAFVPVFGRSLSKSFERER